MSILLHTIEGSPNFINIPFVELPVNMLTEIFKLLPWQELACINCVNKKFKNHISQEPLLKNFFDKEQKINQKIRRLASLNLSSFITSEMGLIDFAFKETGDMQFGRQLNAKVDHVLYSNKHHQVVSGFRGFYEVANLGFHSIPCDGAANDKLNLADLPIHSGFRIAKSQVVLQRSSYQDGSFEFYDLKSNPMKKLSEIKAFDSVIEAFCIDNENDTLYAVSQGIIRGFDMTKYTKTAEICLTSDRSFIIGMLVQDGFLFYTEKLLGKEGFNVFKIWSLTKNKLVKSFPELGYIQDFALLENDQIALEVEGSVVVVLNFSENSSEGARGSD